MNKDFKNDFEKFNGEFVEDNEDDYEYFDGKLKSENQDSPKFVNSDLNSEKSTAFEPVGNSNKKVVTGAIAVLMFLIVVLVSYVIYSFVNNKSDNIFSLFSQQSEKDSHVSGESEIHFEQAPKVDGELTAESIYEMVSPSVVGVVVYDSGAGVISDPVSQGSGIIISEKGYIVTNSHVVGNSKQTNIKIVLTTNEELSGKVIGYDSKTDLAVIKVEKDGLKAATFGNSDDVKVGSSALALGNPLGLDFASSLTRGIVSAVNRSKNGPSKSLVKYIQTDAAINPGNSGGPLIDMQGRVIGINSSKIIVSYCEGMGFAIPSNTVKTIVDDIIDKGYVSGRVRLGLVGKMVSNYQAQIYNVPIGIIVSEISKDSNLSSSGVKVGDIITKINGVNITSFDVFYGELYSHKVGESITLSIYRPSVSRIGSGNLDVNVILLEDKGETQEASPTFEK